MRPSELLDIIDQNTHHSHTDNEVHAAFIAYQYKKIRQILTRLKDEDDKPITREYAYELTALLEDNDTLTANTNLSYLYSRKAKHNIAITEIVYLLSDILDIDPMELVYPRLEVLPDNSFFEKEYFKKHPLMISEDGKRVIDITACLQAAEINDGILRHTSSLPGAETNLSENEIDLLLHNSDIRSYYDAIVNKNDLETKGLSFGEIFSRFAKDLRQNDKNDTYTAVIEFFDWYNQLNQEEKNTLLQMDEFKDIYDRIVQPQEDRNDDVHKYCVFEIADDIEDLLSENEELYASYPAAKILAPPSLMEYACETLALAKERYQQRVMTNSELCILEDKALLAKRMAEIKDFHLYVNKEKWLAWFTVYLKTLNETKRLDIVIERINEINYFKFSSNDIAKITQSLLWREELPFIQALTANEPDSVKKYLKYLRYMSTQDQKDLLEKIKPLTANFNDVKKLVKKLKEENRLEYVQQYSQYITNVEQLTRLFEWLPDRDIMSYLYSQQDKITSLKDVVKVIRELERLDQQIYFLAAHKKYIQNEEDFAELMDGVEDCVKCQADEYLLLVCALMFKSYNDRGLADVISDVEFISYPVAKTLKDFTDGFDLAKFLNMIPDHELLLAQFFADMVQSIPQLCAVMWAIKKEQRITIAEDHTHLVKDHRQLSSVVHELYPEHQLSYAQKFVSIIYDGAQIANIIDAMENKEDKLKFAEQLYKRIRNGYELAEILTALSKKHRLTFAQLAQRSIEDGMQLAKVMECLHEPDRLKFAEDNLHCIKNDAQLSAVVNPLHTNDGLYLMSLMKKPEKHKKLGSVLLVNTMFATPSPEHHAEKLQAEQMLRLR